MCSAIVVPLIGQRCVLRSEKESGGTVLHQFQGIATRDLRPKRPTRHEIIVDHYYPELYHSLKDAGRRRVCHTERMKVVKIMVPGLLLSTLPLCSASPWKATPPPFSQHVSLHVLMGDVVVERLDIRAMCHIGEMQNLNSRNPSHPCSPRPPLHCLAVARAHAQALRGQHRRAL